MTGKMFEPSNGTEAACVYILCQDCERDRASWPIDEGGQGRPEDGCPILAVFGMNGMHPEIMVRNGRLFCAKHVEEGEEIPFVDTETLPMFGE